MTAAIYLDHAAATPVDPVVMAAMQSYFTENFYNPSALYLASKSVHQSIEAARQQIAGWLGARSSEIFFTSGATEANNLAIHGVMQQFPDSNLVVSAVEHDSVIAAAACYDVKLAPVLPNGRLAVSKLGALIDDETVLVSVMYANNEVGTIQPIKEIAELLQTIKRARHEQGNTRPLYLHTDAAQAANYLDLHTSKLGVDLMTLNSGKVYGPKGAGLLWAKTGTRLTSQLLGGGQERGVRSGTENVAAIIGFATALNLVQTGRKEESSRLARLQDTFFRAISSVPGAVITGSLEHRLPNNIHLYVEHADNERLVMELDERGLQVAAGSACSASSDEPSHVLKAMGYSDLQAQGSLRISMGRSTTVDDMVRCVEILSSVILK